ncbi:uncharacterized protein APUU_70680S [Aspergillus puulaauensis]|uniref:Uncharacterized protein n=1 Tax=Aspergillus puulaauensis TaxID=1220207 RepID=A0A7R8ATT1_9EURO|nr:uncharacterized protein APUU_70680S [Aspergillus puulaauensis]BCS29110.1 hypothetical protein APUU_70680S [Aspergillus puulaauensis]
MPFGINPFSKQDHDFPGVIVPLSNAPAHSHPNPQASPDPEKKVGPDDKTDTGSLDRAPSAENGVGSIHSHQPSHDGPLTLEILRAEVENDVVASGHDSAYDRKAKVINRAIQDIGMGRYQWRLFALCGFGWLADNLWLQVRRWHFHFLTLPIFCNIHANSVGCCAHVAPTDAGVRRR